MSNTEAVVSNAYQNRASTVPCVALLSARLLYGGVGGGGGGGGGGVLMCFLWAKLLLFKAYHDFSVTMYICKYMYAVHVYLHLLCSDSLLTLVS